MLQVVQYQKKGVITVEDIPAPILREGGILVRNRASLISIGTERASLEVAQASLLGKARLRPDLLRQMRENVRKEGVRATIRKVNSRLDTYKELGYSSAGIVLQSSISDFSVGDRVACGGAEYAHHGEIIFVPKHLAVKLQEAVTFEEGAFVTLGAVALQGVRQAQIQIGECVVVVGLGLIGLLTVQLLRAAGCHVFGFDVSEAAMKLAQELGCESVSTDASQILSAVASATRGHGADTVIVAASDKTDGALETAIACVRKKGRIVVVGDVLMNIPRAPFYEKELELRISCSYGPGRYDSTYEQQGEDYPLPFVRWTENRNMLAVADMIASKQLRVNELIAHRYAIDQAVLAYERLMDPAKESRLGIILHYEDNDRQDRAPVTRNLAPSLVANVSVVGAIGAGNFAKAYLFPFLKGVRLKAVTTLQPATSMAAARGFGFEEFAADASAVLEDSSINVVLIASRHDSHADFVVKALERGKHVFVEKPLAINRGDLELIAKAYYATGGRQFLMAGFNRRFAEPFREIRKFFEMHKSPVYITYRVNAGQLPKGDWIHDALQGGRIVGEVCHFVDTISYLSGALPVRLYAQRLGTPGVDENVTVTLRMADESIGVIHYVTVGDPLMPKEYVEIFSGSRAAVFDNFRHVTFWNNGKEKRRRFDPSKGHREEVAHFLAVVSGSEVPVVKFQDMYQTSLATILIEESIQTGQPVEING